MNHSGNPGLVATWQINRERAVAFIFKSLDNAKGNIAQAARELKMTRRSLHRWIEEDKSLREKLKELRKKLKEKRSHE